MIGERPPQQSAATAPSATVSATAAPVARLLDLGGPFGRYVLVSAVALAADAGLYLNLAGKLMSATLASILGYALGLIVHYWLSSAFVFPDRTGERRHPVTFAAFAATGGLGLGLTALIVYFFTAAFGASPLAAKAVAVPAVFLAIFVLRRAFVFRA
jgi:putative flippase GtrA